MNNAELIARVRSIAKHGADWRINAILNQAADALEAADKRIAELEAQLPKEGEWMVYPLNDFMGRRTGNHRIVCKCGYAKTLFHNNELPMFCENCGTRMRKGEQE